MDRAEPQGPGEASKLERAMAKQIHLGAIAVAWAAWGGLLCLAQSAPAANPAPCTVAPQPEPCGTTPAGSAKPDTAKKFPFPGETSPAAPSPGINGVPDAPGASGAPSPSAPTGKKEFPFPEDPAKSDATKSDASKPASSGS